MVIHVHLNGPSDSGGASATPVVEAKAVDQGLQGLAPLLHELLSRELVRQSETGSFVLRDDVQQRLRELSDAPVASARQVFIGRKCETCSLIRVTRLINGLRICSDCDWIAECRIRPLCRRLGKLEEDLQCLYSRFDGSCEVLDRVTYVPGVRSHRSSSGSTRPFERPENPCGLPRPRLRWEAQIRFLFGTEILKIGLLHERRPCCFYGYRTWLGDVTFGPVRQIATRE